MHSILCILECTCSYIYLPKALYIVIPYTYYPDTIEVWDFLISEFVKYINVAFWKDKSVLFIEVSSIQRCPDREVTLYSVISLI